MTKELRCASTLFIDTHAHTMSFAPIRRCPSSSPFLHLSPLSSTSIQSAHAQISHGPTMNILILHPPPPLHKSIKALKIIETRLRQSIPLQIEINEKRVGKYGGGDGLQIFVGEWYGGGGGYLYLIVCEGEGFEFEDEAELGGEGDYGVVV